MTIPRNLSILAEGASSTGVLAATNGGTGIASYTIGDLLYGSGTTTLSKLTDVATGSVLISGGVGVAPSWSAAPTLTSITVPTVNSATSLTFQTNGTTTAMTINASQNVGIGTSSPDINLRVSGSYSQIGTIDGTVDNRLVSTSGGAAGIIGTYSNHPLVLYTNINERMRIDTSGNVGIGTSSPVSFGFGFKTLEVAGSGGNGGVFRSSSTATTIDLYSDGSVAVLRTTTSSPILFQTASTEAMRIDASGNVGIGTASPNASAILDAQSTTKGVRFPNMTTTQKNAVSSPAAGLVVFDTTLAKLCVYSGSAWQTITSV